MRIGGRRVEWLLGLLVVVALVALTASAGARTAPVASGQGSAPPGATGTGSSTAPPTSTTAASPTSTTAAAPATSTTGATITPTPGTVDGAASLAAVAVTHTGVLVKVRCTGHADARCAFVVHLACGIKPHDAADAALEVKPGIYLQRLEIAPQAQALLARDHELRAVLRVWQTISPRRRLLLAIRHLTIHAAAS